VAQLQVPPAARRADGQLPRPRLLLPGRRRAQRARRPPAGRAGHGRELAEHLALAGLRTQGANQLAGRFLGPGFYYKTFIRPQRMWPAYERVLQRFVHAGQVSPDTARVPVDKRYAHPDVLVAGGGPAGMTAALAAARAGARVMLVEEEHRLGGHLRWGGAPELAALAGLRDEVAATPGIEVLTNSVVA